MSLQAILAAIHASGTARVAAIEQEAAAEIERLRSAAQAEARQLRAAAYTAELQPAGRERARILEQARLETLCALGEVREGLVDAALEETRALLARQRADPGYPRLLHRLLQEALAALAQSLDPAEQAQLVADPADRETLDSALDALSPPRPVSYSIECLGGVVARSSDGRIVVTNTLEGRLARATPQLRRRLAAHFMGENAEEAPRLTTTTAMPA